MLQLKSIYETATAADGKRYLVELFWPQELHTHLARVDEWLLQLAPSYDLQRFGAKNDDCESYRRRYVNELQRSSRRQRLQELASEARTGTVTLLYAGEQSGRCHAAILKEVIEAQVN